VPRDHHYYVYLLTNWNNKVMYIGMTNDLARRVHEHRTHAVKGFTEKYNVHKLVYFEETSDVHAAIAREKEIKKWRREKKNALVVQNNPEWRDLGNDIGLPPLVPTAKPNVIPTSGRNLES
jgi:putative endonuclease